MAEFHSRLSSPSKSSNGTSTPPEQGDDQVADEVERLVVEFGRTPNVFANIQCKNRDDTALDTVIVVPMHPIPPTGTVYKGTLTATNEIEIRRVDCHYICGEDRRMTVTTGVPTRLMPGDTLELNYNITGMPQ